MNENIGVTKKRQLSNDLFDRTNFGGGLQPRLIALGPALL